ncbi:hypothetical protein G6F29_006593 [Rhizopus arrhizus]|uniref:GATA-type domain-containing protein n=1 Tax=Rhizopus oryzae TaxID=64495 RepID=A0A9P6X4H3_RHIOR|nr:hypothetical protein G6F23_003851 [Rhizopus arrhizus]KAG0765144.1 hypothetical protein G6F24_004649 [Rhizopus arrhizus]KAG0790043.1 hypothetical protein G6F22_006525 [Rhizopus arrhizus]KAG0793413.1 hypothetical protein G6F21_003637 [Rhizopus arrhizus]KAG0813566.1 hypothetical protein G6F20_005463 [Rhizopus arrhizus]
MDVSKLCIDVNNSTSINLPQSTTNNNQQIDRIHIPSLAEFTCNVNKSNNIYHHQLQSQPNHYHNHLPPYPPPSSSSTTTTTHTLPPSYYHPSEEDNNLLLKQVIEQCTAIHQEIARYRVDALTEADRNQIVDLVYYTTDSMIKSLKTLDEQLYPTNEIDYSYPSTPSSSSQTRPFHEDSSKYEMIRQARNLQDNNLRPKYRRRNKRSMVGQRCHSCNTTETPEWRRGPDGARTLCNACGLHYSKLLRKGSLTVQTHNYLLDTPSEKKMPRIIQFPIIQVQANKDHTHNDKMMTTHHNNNNNNNSSSSTSTSSSSHMNNNRRLIDLIDDNQKEHQ